MTPKRLQCALQIGMQSIRLLFCATCSCWPATRRSRRLNATSMVTRSANGGSSGFSDSASCGRHLLILRDRSQRARLWIK